MGVLSFGLPDAKEMEAMMSSVVSDEDRQRWGTLRDRNTPGRVQSVLNDASKLGTDAMSRPLQARMQAAEHDGFRRESQAAPQMQEQTSSGATRSKTYQEALAEAEDVNWEHQDAGPELGA